MLRMNARGLLVAGWCALAVWSPGVAAAQLTAASSSLQPLDQFFEDADPLASSLRLRFVDPRQPVGFQQLYQGPGDLLMRVNGAVTALFPRSVYAVGPRGVLPLIPPGTVFHIGADPASLRRQRPTATTRPSPALVRGLIAPARAQDVAAGETDRSAAPHRRAWPRRVTVWSDERYRQRRLRTLLREALELDSTASLQRRH